VLTAVMIPDITIDIPRDTKKINMIG